MESFSSSFIVYMLQHGEHIFLVLFHLGFPLVGGSVNGWGNPPFHLLYPVKISA